MAKTTTSPPVHQPTTTNNRRRFPRRAKPFQGVYYTQPGERIPTVGLDISGGGLSLLLQHPVKDLAGDLMIGAVIDDKPFSVVARVRWADTFKVKGVDHYRYGLSLSSIADKDWDRLMHWTLQHSGDLAEGATLSAEQRDAMISAEMQFKIGQALVEKERLDPFQDNKLPLIEYNFERYTMRGGIPYMLFKIRSRYSDRIHSRIEEHFTEILVGCEDGKLTVLS